MTTIQEIGRDILLGVAENKHKKTTIGTYW